MSRWFTVPVLVGLGLAALIVVGCSVWPGDPCVHYASCPGWYPYE